MSRTPCRRRRTQRTAPATSRSGRSFFAAASTLGELLHSHHNLLRLVEASLQARAHAVRQQAKRSIGIPAVQTSHLHPRRLNPRVGAMAGKTTATRRVTWAPFQTCVKPPAFANVLLAGERCVMTKLHRPRARTLGTWRASLKSRSAENLKLNSSGFAGWRMGGALFGGVGSSGDCGAFGLMLSF